MHPDIWGMVILTLIAALVAAILSHPIRRMAKAVLLLVVERNQLQSSKSNLKGDDFRTVINSGEVSMFQPELVSFFPFNCSVGTRDKFQRRIEIDFPACNSSQKQDQICSFAEEYLRGVSVCWRRRPEQRRQICSLGMFAVPVFNNVRKAPESGDPFLLVKQTQSTIQIGDLSTGVIVACHTKAQSGEFVCFVVTEVSATKIDATNCTRLIGIAIAVHEFFHAQLGFKRVTTTASSSTFALAQILPQIDTRDKSFQAVRRSALFAFLLANDLTINGLMAIISGSDWSEAEVERCVAAYFEHLKYEFQGKPFVKAHIYQSLSEQSGRSPSSIEFKFQNISAILNALGREWMKGLAPLANYQELLAKKVEAHIAEIDSIPVTPLVTQEDGLAEAAAFYLEAPPELREGDKVLPDYIAALIRKFDPVARDAKNRDLGRAGEAFVFEHEKRFLRMVGRQDLAQNVRWVADQDGDGAGYDILSFSDRGDTKHIEVKTTVGGSRTPFFVTRNEYEFCKRSSESYSLVRLFDFRRNVRGYELNGLLDKHVALSPDTFRAEFHR
jgi:hypothetical protein